MAVMTPDHPRSRLAKVHLWFGCAALLTFVGSGLFLRVNRAELVAAGDSLRLLYRARHLHLLTSGLLHLMAGAASWQTRTTVLRRVGSALLFAAFPTLLWAFIDEPPRGFGHARFVLAGMVLQSAGTLSSVVATLRTRRN